MNRFTYAEDSHSNQKETWNEALITKCFFDYDMNKVIIDHYLIKSEHSKNQ